MKKLIALFLVITFIGMNCAIYEQGEGINIEPGQKPGANLVIQKKDGEQVTGELIAVKKNSVLLMESKSGVDVAVDVEDIKFVKIGRKSRPLSSAGLGFLIGAGIGAVLGAAQAAKREVTSGEGAAQGAVYLGVPCALIGGIVGAFAGKDKTIQFEGLSEAGIKKNLENLRNKARVPNFQ
jgi:hypothetical protein